MDVKRNGAGRQLISVEVDDAGATASVMAVFDNVQQVLRVPLVDQLWRVLAHFPELLPRAWERLAGALGSFEAEQAGDALRRVAVIPLALWLPSHKAFRGDMSRAEIGSDDRERISNFTSAMHYVLPKLLIAAALLEDALQPGDPAASSTRDEFRPLPRGIAPGAPQVRPIDPDHARGQAIELFAEIRKSHGYPALSDYYRSIVMAGDFLRLAWNALRPIVGDPEYYARASAVTAQARDMALQFRQAKAKRLDTRAISDPAALQATVKFYLERLLPETLVEVTIVKGLMDGPDAAAYNRFSLTDQPPA